MICALIQDNIVVDCPVTLDESQVQEYAGRYQSVFAIDGLDPIPKVGWHYVDGKLLDPDSVGNGGKVLLTRFAFFNRFSPAERAALEGFMDVGPSPYKYAARDFKTALIISSYIDRSWQPTTDGMNFLVSISILTEARKNEILNTPAKPTEIYRGS